MNILSNTVQPDDGHATADCMLVVERGAHELGSVLGNLLTGGLVTALVMLLIRAIGLGVGL